MSIEQVEQVETMPDILTCRQCGDTIEQGDTCVSCDPIYIEVETDMYIDGRLSFNDMSQDN